MAYNPEFTPFPSDFISPALKKQKKYNIDYAKAAYYEFVNNTQLLTSTRRSDFISNRLYADGNQSNAKYRKVFTVKDGSKDVSYIDLDYTIVSPIPSYRDIVISYLEKQDYDIELAAIDPVSDNTRSKMVYSQWAEKTLNGLLQMEGMINSLTETPQELFPETKEELEIFKKTCFKLSHEMALKGVIDLDFDRNNWPEIKRKLYEDCFDNGIAGVREYTTKQGVHFLRNVDVVNMYVRNTRDKECKNSTAIGEVIEMTLADFVAQSQGQFTQEEYKKIAEFVVSNYQQSTINWNFDFTDTDSLQSNSWLTSFIGAYGHQKVKIFDLTWMTIDNHFHEKRTNAAGKEMIFETTREDKPKNLDYTSEEVDGVMKYYKVDVGTGTSTEIKLAEWENNVKQPKSSTRKTIEEDRKMVYGCKWIVGLDLAYDYGLQYDLPRDPMPNGRETNLPYHIYRVSNKSMVERMKPFADAFMLTWLKIQNAKAKARPKGIKIELDSLENMTIAGKAFTPLQALAVYDQTGNIIYKGTGQFGEASRHSPVEELAGGMGSEYEQLIHDLNFNVEMCRQVTGFNEIFLASSPDPKQPVRTAEMALQATSNATYPLQSAVQNIHKRAFVSTGCRYQIMSRYKPLQAYDLAISEPMRKVIEVAEDMSLYQYGYKVIIRPTAEQKSKIEAACLMAMNTKDANGRGEITYDDYLFVMRVLDGGNLRYAESVLAHRIQKRRAQYQQEQQQMIQVNAQAQMESNAAAEEQKRQTAQFLTDEGIRLEYAKGDIAIMIQDGKMAALKDIEIIKVEGKKDQTRNQSSAKIITTAITAKNKKEIEAAKPKPKKPASK